MDPLFIATPSQAEITEALYLWPELTATRIRPLLVSAFGEIFVETDAGQVWEADPVEVECAVVAPSVAALRELFADPGVGACPAHDRRHRAGARHGHRSSAAPGLLDRATPMVHGLHHGHVIDADGSAGLAPHRVADPEPDATERLTLGALARQRDHADPTLHRGWVAREARWQGRNDRGRMARNRWQARHERRSSAAVGAALVPFCHIAGRPRARNRAWTTRSACVDNLVIDPDRPGVGDPVHIGPRVAIHGRSPGIHASSRPGARTSTGRSSRNRAWPQRDRSAATHTVNALMMTVS